MGKSLRDKVAVIGVGCTKTGERFDKSYYDLVIDSVYESFEDAGIEAKDIQAAWFGTAFPDAGQYEGRSGMSLAEPIKFNDIPITRIGNYCGTGLDVFRNACLAVASGVYDIVLAAGVEKMRDVAPRDSLISMLVNTGHPFLTKGMTAPGLFGLLANRYNEKYGYDRSYAARVSVKNHYNGVRNPKAHFRNEVTLEQVMNSSMISDPITVMECCPTTDGAAAAVIVRKDMAKSFKSDYVLVKALGASVTWGWNIVSDVNFDFVGFRSSEIAAQRAYKEAGISNPLKELSVAEVHDCFSIAEIIDTEDLGFFKRGEGARALADGVTALDGELPVSASGGLQCCGHPVAATGLRQVYEVTKQLQGKAGEHQVKNAELGLCHNVGGSGAVASVAILGNR